jgi:hypothetical protein
MNYEEGLALKFLVLYKVWNSPKPVREDWVCGSVQELMRHLERDGVTKETVDYLYVHYTVPATGDVMECVAWENTTQGRNVVSMEEARSKRKEEVSPRREAIIEAMAASIDEKKEKKNKPHIKLKAEPVRPVHYSYLHRAQQV